MNRLCYMAIRHSVMFRALLALAVMAAMAIALGTPEVALADGLDGFNP